MTPKEIVTDEEVEKVCVNADFGSSTKREILNQGVLKCACEFYQGSTAEMMLKEHGLINRQGYTLTVKGKAYLWAVFGE